MFRQSRLVSALVRAPAGISSRPIPEAYRPTARLSPRIVLARWYSATAMENNKGAESEEAKAEQDTPAEDPMKKELETKNREIIDLKVVPDP